MKKNFLKDCRTFLFDLDGTVYWGNKPVPGAAELIQALERQGLAVKYVSNNSSHSLDFVCRKLEGMGIAARQEQLITPLGEIGGFLHHHFGTCRVFPMGAEALAASIRDTGHRVVSGRNPCDVVVIGRDIEITYEKLETACIQLQRGAACVVCNADRSHPGELGYLVPETGAFYQMVSTVVEPRLCLKIGKPEPYLYTRAFAGSPPERCVMVGDNGDTDILGAKRAGCRSVLIRGPLTAAGENQGDLCVEHISDIMAFLS